MVMNKIAVNIPLKVKKFPKWKAIVIGDEPRSTLFFKHKRLENLGFLNHEKVLKICKCM